MDKSIETPANAGSRYSLAEKELTRRTGRRLWPTEEGQRKPPFNVDGTSSFVLPVEVMVEHHDLCADLGISIPAVDCGRAGIVYAMANPGADKIERSQVETEPTSTSWAAAATARLYGLATWLFIVGRSKAAMFVSTEIERGSGNTEVLYREAIRLAGATEEQVDGEVTRVLFLMADFDRLGTRSPSTLVALASAPLFGEADQ